MGYFENKFNAIENKYDAIGNATLSGIVFKGASVLAVGTVIMLIANKTKIPTEYLVAGGASSVLLLSKL